MKDIEINILSCLLLKPELMENNKLEDKYFKKHKRLWIFMKAFYGKFKTFDSALMMSVCNNQWKMALYLESLFEVEPAPSNFYKYQDRLIEEYYQSEKNRWIINRIYELSNDLYVNKITIEEFKTGVQNVCSKAESIKWKEE